MIRMRGAVLTVTGGGGGGTVADPLLLPLGTGVVPGAGTYARTLSAGQHYIDPVSGVTVVKVTDTSSPSAGNHGTNYPTGGPHMSQAWVGVDGHTYYSLIINNGRMCDIRYDLIGVSNPVSNWRTIAEGDECGHAWSCDPATPRILYVTDFNRTVNRYNTAVVGNPVLANTAQGGPANWPWTVPGGVAGTYLTWIQTQVNDTWLVGMFNSNSTFVAYRQSDGAQRNCTTARSQAPGTDEPHLDLTLPVMYIVCGGGEDGLPWQLDTDVVTPLASWDPTTATGDAMSTDHSTPVRGGLVGTTSWETGGGAYYYNRLSGAKVRFQVGKENWHGNDEFYDTGYGNLFGHGTAFGDQWVIGDNGFDPDPELGIRKGVLGMVNLGGAALRYLCSSRARSSRRMASWWRSPVR
jgi:hypothetical protein